jgi:DNA-binding transcriptional regulator YdaS (Cro superfamily)
MDGDDRPLDQLPRPGLPMSGARLEYCLDVIGWTPKATSRRLRIHPDCVRQMVKGKRNIPNQLAIWIEKLAAGQPADEYPENWRAVADETAAA